MKVSEEQQRTAFLKYAEDRVKIRLIHKGGIKTIGGVPVCSQCDKPWPCRTVRVLDGAAPDDHRRVEVAARVAEEEHMWSIVEDAERLRKVESLLAQWEARDAENHRLLNEGSHGSVTFPAYTAELRATLKGHHHD